MTIDILPDVALLEIFDFYLVDSDDWHDWFAEDKLKAWYALVRVCRKWRSTVFGSPLRLNLRLFCKPDRTPVKETMVAWPELPIIVSSNCDYIRDNQKWVDNIVAVFKHSDRICRLHLLETGNWRTKMVFAAMQQPFPALTHLSLHLKYELVVPDSFLGGSAPQLQFLSLTLIPFPGVPKILLSATRLVCLLLREIPHSGYISPETMVASLSVLTRLEEFTIGFKSPQSRPDPRSRRPPPLTRNLLPVLNKLYFYGASEYLEDLVARIDAPLLNFLRTTFFHQLTFDTPQLTQFICRCTPKFKTLIEARLDFNDYFGKPNVALFSEKPVEWLIFGVSCDQSDWQLSFMTQMCSSSFPQGLISMVENLCIKESNPAAWQDDIEGGQWLEVLQPFTAVKDLYVSKDLMPRIAPALQELIGEKATEVLPALQTLFLGDISLSGPVQDAIDQFVAARQLAGHTVAVSRGRYEDDSESDESSNERDDGEVESSYETDDG